MSATASTSCSHTKGVAVFKRMCVGCCWLTWLHFYSTNSNFPHPLALRRCLPVSWNWKCPARPKSLPSADSDLFLELNICGLWTDLSVVTLLLLMDFPIWERVSVTDHLSPQELILITWHLTTWQTSCLLTLFLVASWLQTVSSYSPPVWVSFVVFATPTEGKLKWETMWHIPLSHSQMFTLSCLLCLAVTSSLSVFCVQQARWCRTPVSFGLSRCFTQDMYQNIETLVETTDFNTSRHVWVYQRKYWRRF